MAMKFKILLVISSLALTLSLMSNTYSRYVADVDSNIDLLFAKWQILVNENDITNNTTTSINITPVMEENVNVAENTARVLQQYNFLIPTMAFYYKAFILSIIFNFYIVLFNTMWYNYFVR